MQTILTVVHLVLALSLVGLVLLQHGKGADAGAAFGSGASSTVFGARGSGSFLTRSTAALATLFFVTSIALAYYSAQVGEPEGLMDRVDIPGPAVLPQQDDTGDLPVAPGDLDAPPVPLSEAPAPRAAGLPASRRISDVFSCCPLGPAAILRAGPPPAFRCAFGDGLKDPRKR